ncbi:hypothetical protein [Brevibacillus laterosporus]|uniref:glycoside hydrolase family 78 protein n=1 Tax=Brevibacillus laterosporus TaxID=1465 RepID=UPI0014449592|nr:hypothetical protein [Brevibacillus laterosporus]NKQ20698.1 hypothetical protein [Brevibacillus laterosporus]WNX29694.1 hypothetical protein RWW94_15835 [Brevibacillus laterosporus]
MGSTITIPYKWNFSKDPNTQNVTLKKGDLIVGFVRSSSGYEKFEITSNQGGISLLKSSAYNTAGNIPDSISAVVYIVMNDVNAVLTFRSLKDGTSVRSSIAAVFRNAELVAFDSLGYQQGTPDQTLPTNKQNGMGILLINRYTPHPQTENYTVTLQTDDTGAGATMLTLDNISKQHAKSAELSNKGTSFSAIVAILLAPAIIGPNKPTNLSPSGSSSSPTMVGSKLSIAWSYSSPDVGSVQKSKRVVIRKKVDNSILMDTGRVISGSSTHDIAPYNLRADTDYYYTVQVWDQYDNPSLESDRQYFKTYKAPTATALTPIGSKDKPGGTSLTPTLKWAYNDPQGIKQYTFDIKVKRVSDNFTVDNPSLTSIQSQYTILPGRLEAGVLYSWSVRVESVENLWGEWTPEQYFITNRPPSAPTLTSPVDTYRTSTNPIFEAIAGSDPENDRQGFVIELASDEQFTQDTRVCNSKTDYKNWSYYDGHEWKPFDDYTLSNETIQGKKIRFDMLEEVPLTSNTTYYWRMAGVDGTTGALDNWSTTQSIRVGNVLQFQLKEPIMDKVEAHRLVMNAVYKIANDGANPAKLLIEVSNNSFDDSPTWEDMTQAFLNRDYLDLQNRVKQADKWGLNVRITVFANDSLGPIEFDAFGFSYD